jgi:hypothetical protein
MQIFGQDAGGGVETAQFLPGGGLVAGFFQ